MIDQNRILSTSGNTASGISPVTGKNIEAERSNNYSPETAIAEIIDNSWEANAKNIKIRIKSEKRGTQRVARPTMIAIGDDGDGMDSKTLQYCLRLGQSTRFNSRKGLGRFGVGMTKGAIALCKKIEVYSRKKGGRWNYVVLDLGKQDQNGDPYITIVDEQDCPDEFTDLVGDWGTLVVWSDIDRIDTDFTIDDDERRGVVQEGLRHWIGRTFRKYIGEKIIKKKKVIDNPNQVNIFIDDGTTNEKVVAFDPLYVIPNPLRPNDDTAKLESEEVVEFEVSDVDKPDNPPRTGKIIIRLSVTPESFRNDPDVYRRGGTAESKARYLPNNEGFSVLRNGREVLYHTLENWVPTPHGHPEDRFWSCEIDFESVLDHHFKITNVKVGAKPTYELRTHLQKKISPTIQQNFRKQISGLWTKLNAASTPTPSQPNIPITALPPVTGTPPTPEEESQHEGEEGWNETIKVLSDPKCAPIVIVNDKDSEPDDPVFSTTPYGGKTLQYRNLQHAFWQAVFERIEKIKELAKSEGNSDKIIEEIVNLRQDIDRMFMSFAIAIKNMNGMDRDTFADMEAITETFLNSLSLTLRNLYKDSPKK